MLRASLITLLLGMPFAATAEIFVALAVDEPTMRHGFGVSKMQGEAEELALADCGESGNSCAVGYVRSNTCVAFAADKSSGSWGAHRGASRFEAGTNAVEHCVKKYNSGALCHLVDVRCATEVVENN